MDGHAVAVVMREFTQAKWTRDTAQINQYGRVRVIRERQKRSGAQMVDCYICCEQVYIHGVVCGWGQMTNKNVKYIHYERPT